MSWSPGGLFTPHLPQPLARSAQALVLCVKDRVCHVLPVKITGDSQSPQNILWFLARLGLDTGHHSVTLGERLSQCFLGATGGLSGGRGSQSLYLLCLLPTRPHPPTPSPAPQAGPWPRRSFCLMCSFALQPMGSLVHALVCKVLPPHPPCL